VSIKKQAHFIDKMVNFQIENLLAKFLVEKGIQTGYFGIKENFENLGSR